jgi:hypothetical protein
MSQPSFDFVDKALAEGMGLHSCRIAFGELSHQDRCKVILNLRESKEMSEREYRRRAAMVNAIVTLHSRINNVVFGE